ncbi:hypothetical protein P0Y35_01760 [Kiritimatiellaeota bacterium B1221]|nr:hypothetical protein [Kiritimatiellaeota bacterium B1221]
MKHYHIPIIDLNTFTRNLGDDIYCDHVHFLEAVRQQQAGYIAGWLSAYIQYPQPLPGKDGSAV